jgi:hypothetical protein
MVRNIIAFHIIFFLSASLCTAQDFVKATDLIGGPYRSQGSGRVDIIQEPGVDSLLSRYILYKKNNGTDGHRIQIYASSARNAREESARIRAEFISRFPDIPSYSKFDPPGYYKIRVGDYRTKTEATKYLIAVRRIYRDAYLVPDIINFQDLNKK